MSGRASLAACAPARALAGVLARPSLSMTMVRRAGPAPRCPSWIDLEQVRARARRSEPSGGHGCSWPASGWSTTACSPTRSRRCDSPPLRSAQPRQRRSDSRRSREARLMLSEGRAGTRRFIRSNPARERGRSSAGRSTETSACAGPAPAGHPGSPACEAVRRSARPPVKATPPRRGATSARNHEKATQLALNGHGRGERRWPARPGSGAAQVGLVRRPSGWTAEAHLAARRRELVDPPLRRCPCSSARRA